MIFPSTRSHSTRLIILIAVVVSSLLIIAACGNSDDENPASKNEGPVILADGTHATQTPLPIADEPAAVPDGLQIVWETYSILLREYVIPEHIDPDVLAEAAVIGMLDAFG